ncbi:MAG: VCBS repeat-containing protein, partial [Flavobacteriaceae bacterium]
VADFNNDGWMDLFQLDMSSENNFRSKANMSSMDPDAFYQSVDLGLHHQYMQNSLQFNQGNLKDSLPLFSNVSRFAGVSSTDWSWGGLLADFDNDGWKDLIVTNGIRRDVNNKDFYKKYRSFFKKMETDPNYKNKEEEVELLNYLKEMPSEKLSNYIYQNNKNLSFINKIEAWGLEEKTFSNGLAFSDLDNDGDLDFIINNLDDPASIYKNNTTNQNYIHLQLAGKGYQTPLGARVHIQIGKEKQTHEYNVVRGYMSSVSPKIHFGLGKNERIDTLTVQWPNGKMTQLHQVQANQTLTIDYDSVALLESIPEESFSEKLFSTKTDPTPYKHEENPFDDFQKEVLLPHKNSTLGPTLAVGDLNGDDKQDYIIGGAIGQAAKIFIQEQEGHFKKIELDVFEEDKFYEDLGILLIDADQDGDKDLYFASGGNEYAFNSEGYEDRFYENLGDLNFKRNKEAIPSTRISGIDVSSNDFDNDGDLDLFVGGRLYPKKYPYPVSSRILENQSTAGSIRFVDVTEKVAPPLEDIGLVTDSQWL